MTYEEFEKMEPTARRIGDKVAYAAPLTLGRGRVNVTTVDDLLGVHDFY